MGRLGLTGITIIRERSLLSMSGGRGVIEGNFDNGFASEVHLKGSSLSVAGDTFVGRDDAATIEKGSTVFAGGGISMLGGPFLLDKTSSVTTPVFFSQVSPDSGGASAHIDGTLLVKGSLVNGFGAFDPALVIMEIGGLTSVHAVENDGTMTVNGTLAVNGGGFSNNAGASLTVSGFTNVTGGFTSSGGPVIVNPFGTLTVTGGFSNSGGSVIVNPSGTLSADSFQSDGNTIVESGGKAAICIDFHGMWHSYIERHSSRPDCGRISRVGDCPRYG